MYATNCILSSTNALIYSKNDLHEAISKGLRVTRLSYRPLIQLTAIFKSFSSIKGYSN